MGHSLLYSIFPVASSNSLEKQLTVNFIEVTGSTSSGVDGSNVPQNVFDAMTNAHSVFRAMH
jgi:hypothetical protein